MGQGWLGPGGAVDKVLGFRLLVEMLAARADLAGPPLERLASVNPPGWMQSSCCQAGKEAILIFPVPRGHRSSIGPSATARPHDSI